MCVAGSPPALGLSAVHSPRPPLAVAWHNNIVDHRSVYRSSEPQTEADGELPTLEQPREPAKVSLTLGWDTCASVPNFKSASLASGRATIDRLDRHARLPVSEMSVQGVRWWQRQHFVHIFSKDTAQVHRAVLGSAAVKCLQGMPSTLFVCSGTGVDVKFRLLPALAQLNVCTERDGAPVVQRLVSMVTHLGSCFRQLMNFANFFIDVANSRSTILSAFAGFVQQTLDEYQTSVVRFSEGPHAHDVLKLLSFAERVRGSLVLLARVCRLTDAGRVNQTLRSTTFTNGLNFYRGAELLSYLFAVAKESSVTASSATVAFGGSDGDADDVSAALLLSLIHI